MCLWQKDIFKVKLDSRITAFRVLGFLGRWWIPVKLSVVFVELPTVLSDILSTLMMGWDWLGNGCQEKLTKRLQLIIHACRHMCGHLLILFLCRLAYMEPSNFYFTE